MARRDGLSRWPAAMARRDGPPRPLRRVGLEVLACDLGRRRVGWAGPAGAGVDAAAKHDESGKREQGPGCERAPVAGEGRDGTEDDRTEALGQVEEAAHGADDRRPLLLGDVGERERQDGRVQQRYPTREDDRADDEAHRRGPCGDDRHAERAETGRTGAGAPGTEGVGQARPDDPDREDHRPVEQEDPARVRAPDIRHVQRNERDEAGEADEAEEEHESGTERRSLDERRSLGSVCRSKPRDVAGGEPDHRADGCQPGGEEPHRVESGPPEDGFAERGTECEPAVHRDRPVADGLAPAERRGEAISYWSVAVYGGLAFGPALGEAVLGRTRFDSVWLLAAGLAAVGAVIGLATRDVARLRPADGAKRPPLIQRSALGPGLVLFLGLVGLAGFVAFVPLYVSDIGISDSSGLFLLYGAMILAIRIIGARLPDTLGPRRAGTGATGFGALGMAIIAAWASPVGLVVGTIVFACGISLLYPAVLTLALTDIAEEERASVVGTVSSFFDLSQGFGAVILGAVAALAGYRGAFAAGALFSLAGLIVLRSGIDPRTRRTGPSDAAAAESARENLEPDPP